MWLRLVIKLAPWLLLAAAGLVRRYRWPIYYRSLAYRPGRLPLRRPGRILGLGLLVLLLIGVGLYLLAGWLAPGVR